MVIPDTIAGFLMWGLAWLLGGFFFAIGQNISRRVVG